MYDGDLRPTICYRYWSYGHKARYCRRTALYSNCAGHKHPADQDCPATNGGWGYCCPVCKGAYGALSKRCLEYRKQWATARHVLSSRPTHFVIGGRGPQAPAPDRQSRPAHTYAPPPGASRASAGRRRSPSPPSSETPGLPRARSPAGRPTKRHWSEAGITELF